MQSDELKNILSNLIEGEVENAPNIIKEYSRDTSLFEIKPKVVVFPKNIEDIKKIVKFVSDNKEKYPDLSITTRSAGSDMTGGPLNDSIIIVTTKYLNNYTVNEQELWAIIEPGVFYRDFEKKVLPDGISFPSYPASKLLAAFGGIVMNNSGGEKTLRYGQTRDYVEKVWMILDDGNEYEFGPVSAEDLKTKMNLENKQGEIYRQMVGLFEKNKDLIFEKEPKVSKNSSGYALWKIWDKKTEKFNLAQVLVGSQGTLGVMTKAKIRLIKEKPFPKMVVAFFKNWDSLPQFVNAMLPFGPETLETFDRDTLILGLRFMPEVAKKAGESFFKFASRFIPEVGIGFKMLGMPKLIVLIELAEDTEKQVNDKAKQISQKLSEMKIIHRTMNSEAEMNKYIVMRHESFNLLRQHVNGKRTAPFVEDFGVPVNKMPEFLPKVLKVLKENSIKANIAGHAGNGNYHIIPLMDFSDPSVRAKIVPVADKIYQLIVDHGGTITAEHNDGIMRTPYLPIMFGDRMVDLFQKTKEIFDQKNIFNPRKKVGGTKSDINKYMAKDN